MKLGLKARVYSAGAEGDRKHRVDPAGCAKRHKEQGKLPPPLWSD